jgi:predicted Rossmann fold nucleotide-binding protein DprA/Smf involved in DNA uptake
MEERNYYLGFALASGIGRKRFASLLKTFKIAKKAWEASESELRIVQLLENEGLSFDEIVRRSKLNSAIVASLIFMSEIKGIIQRLEGFFQLTP